MQSKSKTSKGLRTSEFYLTAGSFLISICSPLWGADAGIIAASLSVVGVYVGGRSYVKGKTNAVID